jgi:hypothetical protein
MNEQGGHRQLVARPRYEELADTLNAAFKQLDKSFLYEYPGRGAKAPPGAFFTFRRPAPC